MYKLPELEALKKDAESFIDTIDNMIQRRKEWRQIDPGDGYRLLEDNEIIKDTDEFYDEITGSWSVVPVIEEDKLKANSIVQKIRRKIDTRDYIKSADDIAPWQFYINDSNNICKMYSDIGESDRIVCIYDEESFGGIGIYKIDDIIKGKFRIAEIHEIPDECLIGSRVRGWSEVTEESGFQKETFGILVAIDEVGFPYQVFERSNMVCTSHRNIELIDPKEQL